MQVQFVEPITLTVQLTDEDGLALDTTTQDFNKDEIVAIADTSPYHPLVQVAPEAWEESKLPQDGYCNLHLTNGGILLQVPNSVFRYLL